jgi:hypothetical protein
MLVLCKAIILHCGTGELFYPAKPWPALSRSTTVSKSKQCQEEKKKGPNCPRRFRNGNASPYPAFSFPLLFFLSEKSLPTRVVDEPRGEAPLFGLPRASSSP